MLVLDANLDIVWHNPAATGRTGYRPDQLVGRSIMSFLHPDDHGRAAEVVGLIADGVFEDQPVAPALYRVRLADGGWMRVEINAAKAGSDGDHLLLLARFAGDLVFMDRLLESVTAGVDFDQQVDLVLQMGLWRYPGEGYAILYREQGERRRTQHGDLAPELCGEAEVVGPTPWGRAMAEGIDVNVQSVLAEAGSESISEDLARLAHDAGFVGCLASPVTDPEHGEAACIVIWSRAMGPTLAGHRYALDNMRRALALVLQQRAQVLALERAAHVDMLTGLATRTRFFQLLDAVDDRQPEQVSTVLYIDLDGFKAVNDRLGHGAGDRVLTVFAERIVAIAPAGTRIGRLGGDEFALLCPPGTGRDAVTRLADEIVAAAARPIDVGQRRMAHIGASVGIAIGRPGELAKAVLDRADAALIRAKTEGRGRWSFGATVTPETGASDEESRCE